MTTAPKYFALRRRYPRRAARRGWAAEWAHGAAFAGMTLMRDAFRNHRRCLFGTMRPGAAETPSLGKARARRGRYPSDPLELIEEALVAYPRRIAAPAKQRHGMQL